jgi:hypothetical protein
MNKAFFISVILTIALGAGCTSPSTQVPTQPVPADINAITMDPATFGTSTVSSTEEHISLAVITPYMKDGSVPTYRDTFNQRMSMDTDRIIQEFRNLYASSTEEVPQFEGPDWELDVVPLIPTSTGRIQSVILNAYQYTGGAHGLAFAVTEMFDLQNGKFLTINDLFEDGYNPLPEIASSSNRDLLSREYVKDDPDWVNEGTQPTKENFSTFYVTPNGLNVMFSDYQIGPHALGPQMVTIPWDQLDGLKPEYKPQM